MAKYSIKYDKPSTYTKHRIDGVFVHSHKDGTFTVDFYEDTPYYPGIVTYDDGEFESMTGTEIDTNRVIHFGISVSLDNIPGLIEDLQKQYDKYLNRKNDGEDESDD